jgi:cytoskeletal protein CcmA (bactofilin family)
MWNKRPDEELPRSYQPPVAELSAHGPVVIPKAVKIVGEIYSNEDLVIEGFVEGTVEALNQKVTVGHNGTLHATVQVRELDVLGTVLGDVDACERIDIRKDARLVGDIRAARIVIDDGAQFKGSVDIVRPETAVTPQPVRPAAVTEEAFDLVAARAC